MRDVYSRGELGKKILKGFLLGGLAVSCVVLPGMAPILKFVGATNARERQRVMQSLRQLQKKGLLMRRVVDGKEKLIMTTKGEQKLAEYLIEDLKIKKQKRWDRKWRVLMFDIPETKGRVRREVSWKLKDTGMKAIQNSVFISPYPCKKEIDLIANHYFVKKYFIYLETSTIESREDLLQKFNLK